jgi:hypothetical protein
MGAGAEIWSVDEDEGAEGPAERVRELELEPVRRRVERRVSSEGFFVLVLVGCPMAGAGVGMAAPRVEGGGSTLDRRGAETGAETEEGLPWASTRGLYTYNEEGRINMMQSIPRRQDGGGGGR